jgi:glucose uptake protein GlcU
MIILTIIAAIFHQIAASQSINLMSSTLAMPQEAQHNIISASLFSVLIIKKEKYVMQTPSPHQKQELRRSTLGIST